MQLSNNTQAYLCRFYEILDTMVKDMTGTPLIDSVSHNFITQMIPHHMAAIEMSQNLLRYTTLIPLQDIAQNIITEQTEGIHDMKAALSRCSGCVNSPHELCLYQKRLDRIVQNMFSRMNNACRGNDINWNFMREMIPHHEGAIQMSKNALYFPICPELVPILEAIITSQEKGVRQMKCLLRRR